jgi:hypothetical protein
MKIEFDIDIGTIQECPPKDGQISVKLPKEQELRFKLLNVKHEKKLSAFMRDFALKLMDKIEIAETGS